MEQRDIEKYLGIERPLNNQRVDEIRKYVSTVDATFPTAVILAVKSEDAEFNEQLNAMSLTRHDSVAKIIDGQHRIAGLKGYVGPAFVVNVAIFVDMDIEDQATVFSTINLAQTKVGKSLVYDLYDYAKSRSPQKTAHNIARVLNREKGSPFRDRIKILGVATPGKTEETITQATFVESLLPYLTQDRIADRDALKRGKALDRYPADEEDTRFLRNLFLDERDVDITLLLWNYFTAVQRRWTSAWTTKARGNILNRANGFRALMRFFPNACRALGEPDTGIPAEAFETLFTRVKLNDEDFDPDRFKPGTSGESALVRELQTQTGLTAS